MSAADSKNVVAFFSHLIPSGFDAPKDAFAAASISVFMKTIS